MSKRRPRKRKVRRRRNEGEARRNVPTPHDALFHATFSKRENAAAELRRVLPPEVAGAIDFDTLKVRGSRYVDEALWKTESDLLYSVELDGVETLLYILAEHQSEVDRAMPFRLLRYMANAWLEVVKSEPNEPAPAILPVVLHHSASGWTAATQLWDVLAVPEFLAPLLAPYVPDFRFVLHDLSEEDFERLRTERLPSQVKLVFFLLQHTRKNSSLGQQLVDWAEIARALGPGALREVFCYLLEVSELKTEEVQRWARLVSLDAEEIAMTAAEKLRQEGLAEGLSRGLAQGQRLVLLKLLARRFGPLPAHVERRVHQASSEEIEAWTLAVLEAKTLDDVFGT